MRGQDKKTYPTRFGRGFHGCKPFWNFIKNPILYPKHHLTHAESVTRRRSTDTKLGTNTRSGRTRCYQAGIGSECPGNGAWTDTTHLIANARLGFAHAEAS